MLSNLNNISVLNRQKKTPVFSPKSLFSAGEKGVWYDPNDMSTLFQDSAGTTPVTDVEQPVGLMLDKSKNSIGSNGAARYKIGRAHV